MADYLNLTGDASYQTINDYSGNMNYKVNMG